MIGKTLGHYQVTSQLGKGGMGEVYQAKDLKLSRDVAIKVLPEEFAKDADRVARFQREAKLLASLNHPNIAAIHGLEEFGGTQFLVMELVEGETLADQIKRGPIQVEDALKLALQIAEALEAAHDKGVIHRDLKPANIKVTPEGKVKVLDFGLAKAFAGEEPATNLSNSPTLSDMATMQGVILGTAAYMSPEQARGKPVDKRADIWAFGCVLYEMLTGQAAFQGEDVTEILAAVVKGGANLDLLPTNMHPRVREALSRCLQKDLRKRYQDIGDVRFELEQILVDPGGVLVPKIAGLAPRTTPRTILPWVAAIIVAAILTGAAVWRLRPTEPRKLVCFDHELTEGQLFFTGGLSVLDVSPDGRKFVYATDAGLYLRPIDEMDAKFMPGTAGSDRPFFSPDGNWVGFFSSKDGKLKKIAVAGGAPATLARVDPSGSFSWGAGDAIVYGTVSKGIMRVSANAGMPEQIVKAAEMEQLIHPQILPDGKSILFTRASPRPVKIMLQSLKTGERRELFEGNGGKYLPTGHIVFESEGSLSAIQFDLGTLKPSGGAVPVVQTVWSVGGPPQYAVSGSGTLIYVPGSMDAARERTLVWVSRDGKEEPAATESNQYLGARISPDGTKAALHFSTGENLDVWVLDVNHKTLSRLTLDPAVDMLPLWTKDGKRIAFFSSRDGAPKVYIKAADGTGKDEVLGSAPGAPASWSKDGKILVLQSRSEKSGWDIDAVPMEGDRKSRQLLNGKYHETQPQVSPDGRWIAYTSDESGQPQVYVRTFPDVDSGGRWQISRNGGDSALWSPDGRELFYHTGNAVMAVPVETDAAFTHETPELLFQKTYVFPAPSELASPRGGTFCPWDIHPDGKRFLMIKRPGTITAGEKGPRKINIVLNWFEDLKQKVPAK